MGSTTRMVSARERARARAAWFRERERALEDLAVEFFTAADQTAKVFEVRDREVAAAEAKAERAVAASVEAGDVAIRRMLALEVPQGEVRNRLGCTSADVRRAASTSVDGGAELEAAADEGVSADADA